MAAVRRPAKTVGNTRRNAVLELYHFNDSVCAQKVRVVLAEKHLDWVPHHVDLMKLENLDPAYLKLNPNGVVPTLVHDGAVVIESSEIIEYLDEHFPDPPLRPADPGSLERMREWIRLEDDTGLLAVGAHTMQKFIKPHMERLPAQAIDAYETDHPMKERGAVHALVARGGDVPQFVLDEAAADLEAAIARMEEDLATGPWLAAGTYSLADATWTPFVHRMLLLGMDGYWADGRRPRMADWWTRIRARPSYREAILAYPSFAEIQPRS
jgi:glutathione S-transferase